MLDRGAHRRFAIAAPWMRDAAGALSRGARYRLERAAAGGWVLRLALDDAWLDDPARRYPVVVDPTVYPGPSTVCELVSGDQAEVSRCFGSDDQVWIGREAGRVHRVIAKFDPGPVVPADSQIKSAEVSAWYDDRSTASPVDIDTHALTTDFAAGAAWNLASPGTTWSTPGGDFSAERETRQHLTDIDVHWWHAFGIGGLEQAWLDGSRPNDGVLLKAADESASRIDTFHSIHMRVDWMPRLGAGGDYTLEHIPLTDSSEVAVNVANGNLLASATDAPLGDRPDFGLTRTFNAMDWRAKQTFGVDWRDNYGISTRLKRNWQDGSYTWQAPDGGFWHFHKRPDGTFQAPTGLDATLVEHADNTLSLTLEDTGDRWDYDDFDPHYLQRVVAANGSVIDPQANTAGIDSISDSSGRRYTFQQDANADVHVMRDQTGREWHYDYDTNHYLTAATTPDNQQTHYRYDAEELTEVTSPDGGVTRIAYEDGTNRVTAITTQVGTTDEKTTRFAYAAPDAVCPQGSIRKTTVTYPNDVSAVYCFNSALLVTYKDLPDNEAPTLSLADAQARYSTDENITLIDWAPAEDPDLPDGGPSAGIDSYTVTYRLDGAAPVTVTTELPRLQLPAGRVGQAIDLSVRATDVAGQSSATQSVALFSQAWMPPAGGGTLACASTEDGLPPECNDADDGDEVDGGPAAHFTSIEPESGGSVTATATGLERWRINVVGNWTTARLRPGSYVVGNVRSGWTVDRVGPDVNFYRFGTIRGPFQGCGWIRQDLFDDSPYANDGTSNCVNRGTTGPPLASIAVGVNSARTDGSPVELKRNQTNGVRFCAYITPAADTIRVRHDCAGPYNVVKFASLRDGYTVRWRYVVRGRGWVMVRDPHVSGTGTINWWFVRRSAFGQLCNRTGLPGTNPCPPTN